VLLRYGIPSTCLFVYTSTRADVDTAVDFVMQPLLPVYSMPVEMASSSSPLTPPDYADDLQDRHFLFQVNPALSDSARSILNLSNTIESALTHQLPLDPNHLDQEAVSIQRSLLVCETIAFNAFDKAFRLAAMIYMKTLTRPIATIAQTSRILAEQLRTQLTLAKGPSTPLLRWMHFMHLLASRRDSIEYSQSSEELPHCDWLEIRKDLVQVLWVGQIHDSIGEAIWLER
jgi:hypothetical protein